MRTFILLATLLLALPAHATPAPTVQTLLEKHAQAIGPIERVHSRRLRMRIIGMAPFELPVVVEARRPNLIRKEVTIQGNTQVTAFDGKQAWKTDHFVPGGGAPFPLAPAEASAMMAEADFDGVLIQPAAKGIKVAYAGPATIDGKPAHTLQVTLANGDAATIWLDAASNLEIKRTQLGPVMGEMKPLDIFTGDYRLVDGMRMPHRIEIGLSGAKDRMSIIIDAAQVNVTLDPARFAKPVVK
jgi:hypothetical protein